MANSYTMVAGINDPIDVVSDMALSLERAAVLLASTNCDLMECVVGKLTGPSERLHNTAYAIWCSNQVAIEKLQEIHSLLLQAEGPLLALRNKVEG